MKRIGISTGVPGRGGDTVALPAGIAPELQGASLLPAPRRGWATASRPTVTAPFPASVHSGCRQTRYVKRRLLKEYISIHKRMLYVGAHCGTAIFWRLRRHCPCRWQGNMAPWSDSPGRLRGNTPARAAKASCPAQM